MMFPLPSWGKDYLLHLVLLNPLEEKGNVISFMKQSVSEKLLNVAPGLLKILSLSDQYYFYYFFLSQIMGYFLWTALLKLIINVYLGFFNHFLTGRGSCEDSCFVQAVVMQ